MSKETYSNLAGLLFLAMAVFETMHDLGTSPWPGYTHSINAVGFIHVPLFTTAAVGLFKRRSWAFIGTIASTLAALTHAFLIRLGSPASLIGTAFGLVPFVILPLTYKAGLWTKEGLNKMDRDKTQPKNKSTHHRDREVVIKL